MHGFGLCVRKRVRGRWTRVDTHPGDLTVQEAMKDVLVGQDGMASETVEEGLEHPFPLGDHGMVFP